MINKPLLMVTVALTALLPLRVALSQSSLDWRLDSRFGYAPSVAATSPQGAPVGQSGDLREVKNRAWARLQEALVVSRQEPNIPEPLSILKTSLPDAYAQWKEQREARKETGAPREFTRDMSRAAMAWRLYECSYPQADNPLVAKMTEFWFNHLNVYTFKGSVQPFIGDYMIHAIRPNVLGHFDDLLVASFKHPAMLYYLDQWLNMYNDTPANANRLKAQVKGVNENYARELLELHTLGVNSGYTQADVQSLARILTGWTASQNNASGSQFVMRLHDKSDKTLLGQTFTNMGEEEAEKALRFLASQPQTAHRLSLRLAQWFVSDHPSEALVNAMAQTYLNTHGDILEVMHTLVDAEETWDAKSELTKTPVDFVCSALTLAGGPRDLKDYYNALNFLANSGQPMNAWQTPDGYSTSSEQWMSAESLSRRADFAFSIGSRIQKPSTVLDWISPQSRSIIEREKPALQASFSMASPDFMHK
jgi:uncharacterized protein (DUF1800 family)